MSRATFLAAAALAALLGPAVAGAVDEPPTGSFEFRVGTYKPDLDAEFGGAASPYQLDFGTGRRTSFKIHAAKALPWRVAGALELGVGVGYWGASGKGRFVGGTVSGDPTTFKIIPTELTATWRLDVLWERLSIPLVPYARASLQRYNWWITGPDGSTSKSGATNGYALGGGLALVLDMFDPVLAREFKQDAGVDHTMITFDVSKAKVNDFGSGSSWDLSDTQLTYNFGLLLVF
jgi:hypothetical protein